MNKVSILDRFASDAINAPATITGGKACKTAKSKKSKSKNKCAKSKGAKSKSNKCKAKSAKSKSSSNICTPKPPLCW